jgi:hypothetical protein
MTSYEGDIPCKRIYALMKSKTSFLRSVICDSLNDNANVRKCLNKNIYTPGVLDLKEVWGGYANVRTDRGIENGCVEYSVMEWRVVS